MSMLSKNKIKFIQSLSRKKIRDKEHLFLVEGDKIVIEALQSGICIRLLCATIEFLKSNNVLTNIAEEVIEVTEKELQSASLLQSPQNSLAVIAMPDYTFNISAITENLSLALDAVQDPGNMGTILRIADWFGINTILCSNDSADCFNPKVVQASMGAVLRVNVHYVNLPEVLENASTLKIPVFGTFLQGANIYNHPLSRQGILVMGNEGNGISQQVEKHIYEKLSIPSFSVTKGSESLNVAIATAICCSEFRRRIY